jgi:hypothetical protein
MIGQPQMMMRIPWNMMMVGSFLLNCYYNVVILFCNNFQSYIAILCLNLFK